MKLPAFPVEGGCQCRAVRYRIVAGPLGIYACHCKDCQRASGTTHTLSMFMRRQDVQLLQGELVGYDKAADSGRMVRSCGCGQCGTRVWNEPLSFPEFLVVRPGTLDEMSWARPVGNIWTGSKAPWAEIDPAMVNFPGQPPSRQPLFDAWSRWVAED
jgi:hypothetical protein